MSVHSTVLFSEVMPVSDSVAKVVDALAVIHPELLSEMNPLGGRSMGL